MSGLNWFRKKSIQAVLSATCTITVINSTVVVSNSFANDVPQQGQTVQPLTEEEIKRAIDSLNMPTPGELSQSQMEALVKEGQQGEYILGAKQQTTRSKAGEGPSSEADDNVYVGELFGASGNEDVSDLSSMHGNERAMIVRGVAERAKYNQIGCPQTRFTRIATQRTLVEFSFIERDISAGDRQGFNEVARPFTGKVRLSAPAMAAKSWQYAKLGTQSEPNKQRYIKYKINGAGGRGDEVFPLNASLVGVTGTIASTGGINNNWMFVAEISGSNMAGGSYRADVYKYERRFIGDGTGCSADPQSACVHDGVNFCAAPNQGIKGFFSNEDGSRANATSADIYDIIRSQKAQIDNEKTKDIAREVVSTSDNFFSKFESIAAAANGSCSTNSSTTYESSSFNITSSGSCSAIYYKEGVCNLNKKLQFSSNGNSTTTFTYRRTAPTEVVTLPDGREIQPCQDTLAASFSFNLGQTPGPLPTACGQYDVTVSGNKNGQLHILRSTAGGASGNYVIEGEQPNASYSIAGQVSGQSGSVTAEHFTIVQNETEKSGDVLSCEFQENATKDDICEMKSLATCLESTSGKTINGVPISGQVGDQIFKSMGGFPAHMPDQCIRSTANGNVCDVRGDVFGYRDRPSEPMYKDSCHFERAQNGKIMGTDPTCRYIEDAPHCGDLGAVTGICYQRALIYECDDGRSGTQDYASGQVTSETCTSPIRCMGTDCALTAQEASGDFSSAVMAGQVIDSIQQGITCRETGKPPASATETCTPELFKGERRTCDMVVYGNAGLAPNCCKDADQAAKGIDVGDVVKMALYAQKIMSNEVVAKAIAGSDSLSGLNSAWNAGKDKIVNAAKTVTEPISNAVNQLASKFGKEIASEAAETSLLESMKGAVGGAINAFTQFVYKGISDGLTKIGLEKVAQEIFVQGTGEAAGTLALSNGAALLFQAINLAFLIYSMAQLIGSIVFACKEAEYELGIEKRKKNCHYIGRYCSKKRKIGFISYCEVKRDVYCCYSTPLMRIIASQLKKQYGGYGNPNGEQCRGLTVNQVTNADWSKVNLSEWEKLLEEAGVIPNSAEKAESQYGIERDWAELNTDQKNEEGKSIRQINEERFDGNMGEYEKARAELSQMQMCSQDGKLQWYGSSQAAAMETASIARKNISAVGTARFEYTRQCPTRRTTHMTVNAFINPKTETISFTASHRCGASNNVNPSSPKLLSSSIEFRDNGQRINLPTKVKARMCDGMIYNDDEDVIIKGPNGQPRSDCRIPFASFTISTRGTETFTLTTNGFIEYGEKKINEADNCIDPNNL